ncbi:MAG: signal peptidase II [Eubacteriaceae bacterium]|nr:signal peptidase II [Eubacteriaceae bacterium]
MIAAVLLDRAVKCLVVTEMAQGESIPVISGFFHITYIRNTGAAFSLFSSHTWMLSIFTAVLIAAGLVFMTLKRKTGSKFMLASVALIVGGGIGNLIDRVCLGYVVDMFDLKFFAVFNVADIFVCAGCVMLCIYVLFIDGKNDKRKRI